MNHKEAALILEENGYSVFQDDYIKTIYKKEGHPFLVEALDFSRYFILYQLVPIHRPEFITNNKQKDISSFMLKQIHPIWTSEYVADNDLYKYIFKAFISLFEDVVFRSKLEANEHIRISINPLPENYQSGNEYDKLFIPFIVNLSTDSFDRDTNFVRFLVNSSESLIYLYTIDSILNDVDSRVLVGAYSIPLP